MSELVGADSDDEFFDAVESLMPVCTPATLESRSVILSAQNCI
jgi:hypothetical protein